MIPDRKNPILAENQSIKAVDLKTVAESVSVRAAAEDDSGRDDPVFLRRKETAAQFIGPITDRPFHRYGFSKGQFSLIDVVEHIGAELPGAALTISTWTAARADLARLESLIAGKRFSDIRFLIDFSFQRRQPGLIAEIRRHYGPDSIRITRNHAKFLLINQGDWRIVVRTSMNLNFNPGLEDIEVKHDPEIYAFIESIIGEFWTAHDGKAQADKQVRELALEFSKF